MQINRISEDISTSAMNQQDYYQLSEQNSNTQKINPNQFDSSKKYKIRNKEKSGCLNFTFFNFFGVFCQQTSFDYLQDPSKKEQRKCQNPGYEERMAITRNSQINLRDFKEIEGQMICQQQNKMKLVNWDYELKLIKVFRKGNCSLVRLDSRKRIYEDQWSNLIKMHDQKQIKKFLLLKSFDSGRFYSQKSQVKLMFKQINRVTLFNQSVYNYIVRDIIKDQYLVLNYQFCKRNIIID